MEIEDCVWQIQSPSPGMYPRYAGKLYAGGFVWLLPLRAQTFHSKELKQEVSSWCSPQVDLIETNQLPNIFGCHVGNMTSGMKLLMCLVNIRWGHYSWDLGSPAPGDGECGSEPESSTWVLSWGKWGGRNGRWWGEEWLMHWTSAGFQFFVLKKMHFWVPPKYLDCRFFLRKGITWIEMSRFNY